MNIILATGNETVNEHIKRLKDITVIDTCDDLETLNEIIHFSQVDIVIINRYIDESEEGNKIRNLVENLRNEKKEVRFIILLGEYEDDFVLNMVNLGIYDLLIGKEMNILSLEKNILQPRKKFNFEKYIQEAKLANTTNGKEKKQEKKKYSLDMILNRPKRIIAVLSTGPTGKSYILNNLAYIVASQKIKTAVVDGDLQRRAQSYYFYIGDERKRDGLKEMMEEDKTKNIDELGHILLNGNLKVYTNRKYDEDNQEISIDVDPDKMIMLIDYLRSENEVVFVDTDRDIENELTRKILNQADTILLVQNLFYKDMEENKRALNKLVSMNVSPKKMILIVNQYIENDVFDEKVIKKYFNMEFQSVAVIPQDTMGVIKNVRYGKPAVAMDECREDTKEAFYTLAELCFGIKRVEKKYRKLIGRFFS